MGALFGLSLVASPAVAAPDKAPDAPAAPSARREPTAGDLATARTALREGLALRDKGELAPAQMRLQSAYDLVPTPVTGFELGKTHMMGGRVLQAHELFKKVVRMPPSMEESARSQTARDEAARLAKELEPRIPSLRIKLSLPPGATATVKLDEEPLTLSGPEVVRAVDPGAHDLTAKAGDGPEEKVRVEVGEAETKEVGLAPQWVPPKPPPQARGRDVIYVRTTNPLAFVGFGVGSAALITSIVTGVLAVNERDEARAQCGEEFCPPRTDSASLRNVADSVGNLSFTSAQNAAAGLTLVSIVAGVTAVAFVSLGIVGAVRPVREKVVTSTKPTFRLGGAGLAGTF